MKIYEMRIFYSKLVANEESFVKLVFDNVETVNKILEEILSKLNNTSMEYMRINSGINNVLINLRHIIYIDIVVDR